MTDPLSATIRCDDGTEIPFTWVYAGAEDHEWMHDRAHWPEPSLPMELWLRERYWPGADRAFKEVGMEAPAIFYRFQLAGPFKYLRMSPYPPERMAPLAARYREVARAHGNGATFWKNYAQPRIEGVCRDLARAATDAPLAAIAEAWGYGFHQTFTSSSLMADAQTRLTALLAEHAGDDATLLAFEVTQGGDNASQEIDAEIWDLAAIARQSAPAMRILTSDTAGATFAALRGESGAASFVVAFDALIERHGARSLGWSIHLPTWREQPEVPLSLVRSQLQAQATSPAELAARSAAIRAAATERALAAIPSARHDEFRAIVRELDGYVGVREGRAYWQMTITGELRALLLRRGAQLVERSRIDAPDDILLLTPDDLEHATRARLQDLVSERRREWDRWRQVIPPAVIGTPAAVAPPPEVGSHELRGAPASRGVFTGVARVIQRPEDAARLRQGEILVCVMTTPAWTPMFAVAGAVVTETGAALSHPAITAREYGIPAVVAVREASTRIRDGQTITVDGAAGIVSLQI